MRIASGAVEERGCGRQAHAQPERQPAERRNARFQAVGPAAGDDPRHRAEGLDEREHAGGLRRAQASLAVQEEDEEAQDADLRGEDEGAPDRELPHARVAHGVADIGQLALLVRRLAQPARARERRDEASRRERDRGLPEALPAASIGGRRSAASRPPIGSAVCRIPRAKPRSSCPNQLMTARPLAAFTLAPEAPPRVKRDHEDPERGSKGGDQAVPHRSRRALLRAPPARRPGRPGGPRRGA